MGGNIVGRALNTAIPNIIQNVSNIQSLQERAKNMRMEEESQPYRLKGLEQSTALGEITLQQRRNELEMQNKAMEQARTPHAMEDVLGLKNYENIEGAKDVIQEYYKDYQSWGGTTPKKGIDGEIVGHTTTKEKYAQYITEHPDRPIVYLQQAAFRMADAAKNKRAELNELQLKGGNENKIAQLTAEIKQSENGQAFALGRASFIAKQSGLEKDEDFEPAGEELANWVNEKAGKPIISAGSPRGFAMKLAKELGMGQSLKSTSTKMLDSIHQAKFGTPFDSGTQESQQAALDAYKNMQVDISGAKAEVTKNVKLESDIADLDNVSTIVDSIDNITKQLITATDASGALKQGISLYAGAVAKTNPTAAAYRDQKAQSAGILARSLGGEKGVLTDKDITRTIDGYPGFNDTKAIRDYKMGIVRLLLDTAIDAKKRQIENRPQDPKFKTRLNDLLMQLESVPKSYPQGDGQIITEEVAKIFYEETKGDEKKARQLAIKNGWKVQ